MSSRTVWNANASLNLARLGWDVLSDRFGDLIVSFGVKNLTDRSVRDAEFFPQPGRSFYTRVEATF